MVELLSQMTNKKFVFACLNKLKEAWKLTEKTLFCYPIEITVAKNSCVGLPY